MGNINGSFILIIFLLHWQLVSGADNPGGPYTAAGKANPGYPIPYVTTDRPGSAVFCDDNYTLPCAEVSAIRIVINSLRLIPPIYVSVAYCRGITDPEIKCTCDRNDKNFIVCHITEINMNSKELSGYIDPAIGGLQFLRNLYLSSNQLIGSLPASLGNLTNLKNLYIINNQIVGRIPDSFKYLRSLNNLDLSSNYLDGPIPISLGDLQNLTFIGLRFNFLSGPIPPSLGELSMLKSLNLYSNMLSGPIPDQLGNLSQLNFLALDDNELNGTLPEAFGKLVNLTRLWLTSNYFTGAIPQNYSYLTGLQEFALAGNDLSGKIPDYIAEWKNLRTLILLGNNFEGNLPQEIFNLGMLQILWVSGLRNPGFTFPEIKNLTTNLYSLILRNCSINNTIPSYISGWPSLTNLDLSFNNLTGEIPQFTRNLNKIFLARNKLNGGLPMWKSKEHHDQEITNNAALMDLSNNDFANVPSERVNFENGTLFDLPNIIIEYISQKIKDCKVKYRSLSINSGGDEVKFGKQNYENDTALSNFYVSPQGHWAYSFSGDYITTTINASGYIKNLTCGVSLPEAKLYVNARAAPLSLTYYALCLHEGVYNVELLFAETLYSKMEDHSKVGKRVFDVYIKEKRVLQDFNIKKEAGDAILPKKFQTTVTNNEPLKIEFLWTGRGSMYNPPGQNGPLVSAISITRAPRKLSAWEIVVISAACVLGLLILLAFMWRMGWIGDRELRKAKIELETLDGKKSFTAKQIIDATRNFSPKMKIGKDGRFGIVYKAELPGNLIIAVKKLFPQSKGVKEIGTEVYANTYVKLEHENLVKLLATYSRKDLHLLIYEYMDHGSLEEVLFDPIKSNSMKLSWETRYNICLQIAQGLEYLHAKDPKPIIHRDIKTSNVMLDGSSKAKITGFGMAKLYEEDNPFMFIEESGTRMYMAPEYATHKDVTVAVDVYSFGVLILEIVTGKRNDENLSKHEDQTIFLLEKVANLHEMVKDANSQYKATKYVEPFGLDSNYSKEVVTIFDLAILCTNQMASLRPTISDVISVLKREKSVENVSNNKVKDSSSL